MDMNIILGIILGAVLVLFGFLLTKDLIISQILNDWLQSNGVIPKGQESKFITVESYNKNIEDLTNSLNKSLQESIISISKDLDKAINETLLVVRKELYNEIVEYLNDELKNISKDITTMVKKEVSKYEKK